MYNIKIDTDAHIYHTNIALSYDRRQVLLHVTLLNKNCN